MRTISAAASIYFVAGCFTFWHWLFVGLSDFPFGGAWSPVAVSILFGPVIIFQWPEYWASTYRVGGDWLAFHGWAADLTGAAFIVGTVLAIRRMVTR